MTAPESPAELLRRAAARLRDPFRCGMLAVDLPLAAWLEATAARAEEEVEWLTPECGHNVRPCGCDLAPRWSCNLCFSWLDEGCRCGWAEALAFARALLGEGANARETNRQQKSGEVTP